MPARPTLLPVQLRARPFTYDEALALGVTRRSLQGRAVRRLHRGVYVAADLALTLPIRVDAAQLALPKDAVASGVTALQLLGVDVGPAEPLRFSTTSPAQVRQPGLAVTRVRNLPAATDRVPRAEPAFLSAAMQLDLVIAGDRLIRLRRTKLRSLRASVAEARGRGSARARRAVGLVRERVDSPQETRLRLLLALAGLPMPECGIRLGSEQWFIGQVDLCYQRYRLILEYEGDQHRIDRAQWNVDIGRYEEFTQEGYRVIRVTAARMRYPRVLARNVFDALRAAGYQGPPPVFSDEWCRLFA